MRTLTSTTVGTDTCEWPGAKQFLRLKRKTIAGGKTKITVQYAITSLPREKADAARLLALWRSRWAIENKAFWVRDVVFGEDRCRIRTGSAPHVLSVLRNSAITLLHALKVPNITAALRQHALKLNLLLSRLRIM